MKIFWHSLGRAIDASEAGTGGVGASAQDDRKQADWVSGRGIFQALAEPTLARPFLAPIAGRWRGRPPESIKSGLLRLSGQW
jgi:hypothetical protein